MLLFDALNEFDDAPDWQVAEDDPLLELDGASDWPGQVPSER
jgi:hypothetical protein